MIQSFLIIILIFAPIARGAVRIWAFGPIQILILFILIRWLFNRHSSEGIEIKRTSLDKPILLFLGISIIAILNSRYIYGSIMEFIRLMTLAAVFFIVVNFVDTREKIKRIINIMLATGTGIALFGILQYLGVIDNSWWGNARFLSGTYVNHNHFAGLMELVIPLSIGMVLSERGIGKKSVYIYSFLVLSTAFLLSMSRGGWFSLSIAMFFMAVVVFKKGRARFTLFIAGLLLIVLGAVALNIVDPGLLWRRISSYRELDFAGRLGIWKGTLGIIRHNWFLGTGPGSFIYNFPRYRPAGLNMFVNSAHNDYLQVASEIGIFGLGVMVYIIINIIRKGLRTHRLAASPFKSWLSLSLTVGVLSMALHGLGDFNFYIPANAILFMVFSGLIFNISSKREKPGPTLLVLKPDNKIYKAARPLIFAVLIMPIVIIGDSLAAEIYSTISDKYVLRGDLQRAGFLAILASRINPFNYTYPYKLAEIYTKKAINKRPNRGNYLKKSEERYKAAIRLNPMDGWSWIGLGDTERKLFEGSFMKYGLLESAESAYRKALELDPLNSYYLKRFAGFLLSLGDTDLSSALYKKAGFVMSNSKTLSSMAASVVDGAAYKKMADLAFYGQDIRKALIFYKMAEALGEQKQDVRLGLLRCYLRMSRIKDAMGIYRKIRPSRRNRSVLFASLGDYYLARGEIAIAKKFAGESLNADPQNPEAYYLKYKISERSGAGAYPIKEISRILDFNKVPLSIDFNPDGFKIGLKVKKDMYREGKLKFDLILPGGVYELSVRARGKEARHVWPHMILRFNDQKTMEAYVDNADWKEYRGIIVVGYPLNRLAIIYDNDYYDAKMGQDRNLYIDGVTLRSLY